MRGRGASRGNNPDSKWNHINQLVKEKHIGVLAIQETHLTQEHVDDLHQLFGKHLQMHFSQGQNVNAHGVAIVLNREITNIHSIQQVDIILGRAMLLTLPWHSDLTITILNVYASNAHNENQQFWETLELKWVNLNLPLPDIMLEDFNLVEDAIDHLPNHADPSGATNAFNNLRSFLQLKDGWRTIWLTK
jgi:exonuclease III